MSYTVNNTNGVIGPSSGQVTRIIEQVVEKVVEPPKKKEIPKTLPEMKIECLGKINEAAEQARLRYITGGVGQALVYQEKSEQAADFIAAGCPSTLEDFPYIEVEVMVTGKSAEEAADDILSQKSAWISIGSLIEKERLSGKMAVNKATKEELPTIIESIINTLDNI